MEEHGANSQVNVYFMLMCIHTHSQTSLCAFTLACTLNNQIFERCEISMPYN